MKRWSTVAGSVFAALIMGLVLYRYGADLKGVDFTNAAIAPSVIGSLALYVAVILIGALGWRIILSAFGISLSRWSAERQVLIPQIGKYVPGNIAHYLGRAAMTMRGGVPPATVGVALAAEVGATVAGGLLSIALALALAPELESNIRIAFPSAPVFTYGAVLASALIMFVCAGVVLLLLQQLERIPQMRLSGLVSAVALYSLSFLLLGISLRLIAGSLSRATVPLPLSVALFAAAWIAGLVTPGAPGGLGVRESVLTIGLAPILGGSVALAVALIHRGVSVLGDVISFGLGLLLPKTNDTPDVSPEVNSKTP